MPVIIQLFITFFKIGLFTFGGGYAMISIVENNCVERKKWISHDEMMNLTVIAESTPGSIAVNCATYVGYKQAKFWGALVSTFGVVLPSFIIIFLISRFLDNFMDIRLIADAFRGIRIAVGILILDAAVTMIRKMEKKPFPVAVMICACAAMLVINFLSLDFSSIALIITAGIAGLIFCLIKNNSKAKESDEI